MLTILSPQLVPSAGGIFLVKQLLPGSGWHQRREQSCYKTITCLCGLISFFKLHTPSAKIAGQNLASGPYAARH